MQDPITKRMQIFVAVSLMIMVGFALWKLTDAPIPARNDNAFNILLGAILMQFANLLTFLFPSNTDSAAKNATINTLANAAQAAQAPYTVSSTETIAKPSMEGKHDDPK